MRGPSSDKTPHGEPKAVLAGGWPVSYGAPMSEESGTWHYGLIAQWWAEFNLPEPQELGYFRAAIRKFGEPVLDLGCGTGRILMPLLAEGFDVDGSDISADMIALERRLTLEMRARLWRGGQMVKEEHYSLKTGLYFAQEVLLLLEGVGFRDHAIEGNYTGLPATSDDDTVIFVARK